MRVVIAAATPCPGLTGVTTHVAHLAAALRRAGHETVVVAPTPHRRTVAVVPDGPEVPLSARGGDAAREEALVAALRVAAADADVVHAMHPWAALPARRAGCAAPVLTVPGLDGGRRWLRDLRAAAGACAAVLVASAWLAGRLLPLLPAGARRRLRVAPHGVEGGAFARALQAAVPVPRPAGLFAVLFVGRLVRAKGVADLLLATARLRRHGVPSQAWLVGAGPDAPRLARLARRLGLVPDGARLLGPQPCPLPWLRAADAVALPSRQDNLPYALLEAQLAGRPVVAAATGGIPEAVRHGVTGLLVPPQRPDALAAALGVLWRDPERAAQLAAAARREAWRRFAGDAWLAAVLDAYAAARATARSGRT